MDNEITSLEIPNSVETIERIAFRNNHLTSVVIPDSVKFIGERGFDGNRLRVIWTDLGNGAALAELLSVVLTHGNNVNTALGEQDAETIFLIEIGGITNTAEILFNSDAEFSANIATVLEANETGKIFRWDNTAENPVWEEVENIDG